MRNAATRPASRRRRAFRLIGMIWSVLNASHPNPLIADEGRSLVSSSVSVQSKNNGNWSNANTWAGGKIPQYGDHALINLGNTIKYALISQETNRLIHIRGDEMPEASAERQQRNTRLQ